MRDPTARTAARGPGARRAIVPIAFLLLAMGPTARADLGTTLITSQLQRPVFLTAPPGQSRLFVVEQYGRIKLMQPDGSQIRTFIDLTDRMPSQVYGERGLLGLAFSPTYESDSLFYVHYTAHDWALTVSRLKSSGPISGDPDSEEILFQVPHSDYDNHNGGHLEFGPDGMLYIAFGDGGGAGDPFNNGQSLTTLLGKLLRVDVSGGYGSGYTIPPDNPFVAGGGTPFAREEIWVYGLRNPWVFNFDRLTGDLYISDVGQNRREEINVQPVSSTGGENYGWRRMEGSLCFEPPTNCNDGSLVLPVYEYSHTDPFDPCGIIGSTVYRGDIYAVDGHCFFTDFCSDRIKSIVWDGAGGILSLWDHTDDLRPPDGGLVEMSNICLDAFGNLYFLNVAHGKVYRMYGDVVTGVGESEAPEPLIRVAAPNPFRGRVTIDLSLPAGERASVTVLDVQGRRVRELSAGSRGGTRLVWDGRDGAGRRVASGMYIVSVALADRTERVRISLL